jgi:hypothetical protein
MENNLEYAKAMYDRLVDALPGDWDLETKELIGQAFLAGMAEYPDILKRLKSSSLIESDYFDDDNDEQPGDEPGDRIIEGNRYRIRIKTSKRK